MHAVDLEPLQWRWLAQAPAAGFIESDWTDWMTSAVLTHVTAHGRWVDEATPVRVGRTVALSLHCAGPLTGTPRKHGLLRFRPLYPYNGRRYWWLHSWLIDKTGTLIDLAQGQDKDTRLRCAVELGLTRRGECNAWARTSRTDKAPHQRKPSANHDREGCELAG